MKEKPGAQTPWLKINQLLAPDERFEIHFPQGQGLLLAPKHSSQLAALLYLLRQEKVNVFVQEGKTNVVPKHENSVLVSARAFSQIIWYDQGIVEIGAGCSLSHLYQFLFERNQEVALGDDPLVSNKCSVAEIILSGKGSGLRCKEESILDSLLGIEFITWEGNQIKWGSRHKATNSGPTLQKIIWGLQMLPGIIIKIILKTYPIPETRLRLAWNFHQKEALWQQFHDLQYFSQSWEYLDVVLSGQPTDQGFILAQISGLSEEIKAFSQVCPHFIKANQGEQKSLLKNFLFQQQLQTHLSSLDSLLEPGNYLWIQNFSQKAWMLTSQSKTNSDDNLPTWKKFFWKSFR